MYRNTYASINCDKLKNNIKQIIAYHNKYQYYFGVVKANAYGHGDYIVNHLIAGGVNYLAVSSLEEAISVRKYTDIPVLCLEPINLNYIDEIVKNNVTLTVHDYRYFLDLVETKKSVKIHLKIDSGMNRLGIKNQDEVNKIYQALKNNKNIFLEGIYTHLATSGINDKYYDKQIANFKYLTTNIDLKKIPIVHVDRSLTLVSHEKLDFCNGIRLGIMMYGINQNRNVSGFKSKLLNIYYNFRRKLLKISPSIKENPLKLETALELYSEIIQTKTVKKGEIIGYGDQVIAKEDMKIGIIPIGYADGLFGNSIGRKVVINNKSYSIVCGLCMDMTIIKIDETVKLYDKVTLIGKGITVREVCNQLGISAYQLFTSLTYRVPRKYIEDAKDVD